MKIAVLGAGVIGVTSAYYLAKAGHEVIVVDRQAGPARETSFANAGEISPGYAAPWAAPGIPIKALKWLLMKHGPLILRPEFDPAMLRWLLAMLRNCTAARYTVNKERMVRLAEYSRDCLIALREEINIAYDERSQGTLQLFRTHQQLDASARDVTVLRASGIPHELLDPQGCVAIEPGLAGARDQIVGGLRLPNDETGDCFKFTSRLAAIAADKGVRFDYGSRVERLEAEGGRIRCLVTHHGSIRADAYIIAAGSYSAALVADLGIRLPVYPVKGYSLTIPVTGSANAPQSTLMDESYKIAITRLGDRIRVGGMAEIAGFSDDLPPQRRLSLEHSLTTLFPRSGDLSAAVFWSGLRPMTPDGPPIVGQTFMQNLYLNTGHGTLGWTMACGSARILADMVSLRRPEIQTADLSIERYRR